MRIDSIPADQLVCVRSRSLRKRIAAVVALLSALFLMPCCRPKNVHSTSGTLANIRIGYEGYLGEGGQPVQKKMDERSFIEMLRGKNTKNIVFIELAPSLLDAEGYVIDEWRSRIRIEPAADPAGQIEIRSAGSDRTFGTPDDVYVVSGKQR